MCSQVIATLDSGRQPLSTSSQLRNVAIRMVANSKNTDPKQSERCNSVSAVGRHHAWDREKSISCQKLICDSALSPGKVSHLITENRNSFINEEDNLDYLHPKGESH